MTGMKNGEKEIPHDCHNLTTHDRIFPSEFSGKDIPLTAFVFRKFIRENNMLFSGFGAAVLECSLDGSLNDPAFKRKIGDQHPNIIEILHAAVSHSQRRHCLEFLRDDSLRRIPI